MIKQSKDIHEFLQALHRLLEAADNYYHVSGETPLTAIAIRAGEDFRAPTLQFVPERGIVIGWSENEES